MNYQTALFDLDGTLLDSMPMWKAAASRYIIAAGGRPKAGLDRTVTPMDMPHTALYLRQHYFPEKDVDLLAQELNNFIWKQYLQAPLKAGAFSFVQALHRQGVHCAVASATDSDRILSLLSLHRMTPYFDAIVSCTEAGAGKNQSPAVYQKAMQAVGGTIESTLIFEDSDYAVRTALAAGFRVAAIYDDYMAAARPELEQSCAYYFETWQQASDCLL